SDVCSSDLRLVVQLDGPMTPERRARLSAAGVGIGPYLPMHAYIVTLDGADAAAVAGLEFVRWHSVYRREWKVDPDVGARPYKTPERLALAAQGRDHLVAVVFPGADIAEVERAVWAIPGAAVLAAERAGGARVGGVSMDLYLEMNLRDVGALAA